MLRISLFSIGLLAMIDLAALSAIAQTGDYPISPVAFTEVTVEGGFWEPRFETNRTVTIPYDFLKCEETGRIGNFARAGGLEEGGFQGIPFDDSDVFKVVEGAAYSLALHPDPELDAYLDDLIAKIAAAQEDDGYLYTARSLGRNDGFTGPQRWSNLRHNHELYNIGHMYEAAVAHYQATGKRTLLDVAIQSADLVCEVFGPGEDQKIDVPGHQEIEIGLVKLYRLTGDEKYLRQAQFFIEMRGRGDLRPLYGEYAQDHAPVVQQREAVGHAVRGGYLYSGMADVAALTGQEAYIEAIDRIWYDVVSKKMYLTGGVGLHGHGEGYSVAYDLPNRDAYNETCAAIACAQWNHRMFNMHGDAKYIDVMERILYNAFLSGVSLSGDHFFYPNPLKCDLQFRFNHGAFERSPWFNCSCCPVNVVRFIPSMAGYVYAHRGDDAYVNLFIAGSGTIPLENGSVRLVQETAYPYEGQVRIEVEPSEAREFALRVRIPGWARNQPLPSDLYAYADQSQGEVSIAVNGEAVELNIEQGFAVIRRAWQPGDVVELELPMQVRRVAANEKVSSNEGRMAIERGPIVYCVEGVDNEGHVLNIVLEENVALTPHFDADLLGGVTLLTGEAQSARRTKEGEVDLQPVAVTMIPYYAWAHRGENEMAVWLPTTAEGAVPLSSETPASTSSVSSSHCWQNDTLTALNDQVLPQNSVDLSIPRFTWWDHRGTTEWVQYDLAQPTELAASGVYWFDDSGRGGCRVPQSWKLLYRQDEDWLPVEIDVPYTVDLDTINRVAFQPVVTDALRLEVELQSEYSGGILEWVLEETD